MYSLDFFDSFGSTISLDIRGSEVMRITPRESGVNEEWISDKIRFSYDSVKIQRLSQPLFLDRSTGRYQTLTWSSAFKSIFTRFSSASSLCFFTGNFIDLETAHRVHFLSTLSRKIKLSSVANSTSKPLSKHSPDFFFNSPPSQLFKFSFVFLYAFDPRFESPIFNLRLRREVLSRSLRVITWGFRSSLNFSSIFMGNSVGSLLALYHGSSRFARYLLKSSSPFLGSFFSNNLLSRPDFGALYSIFCKISSRLSSPNPFLLGPLSFSSFGAVGAVGVPDYTFPRNSVAFIIDSDSLAMDWKNYSFVVYQGHHGDSLASKSDLILPGTVPTERNTHFINFFGLLSQFGFVAPPPGQSRSDFKIVEALGRVLFGDSPFDRLPCSSFFHYVDFKEFRYSGFHSAFSPKVVLSHVPPFSSIQDFYLSDTITRFSRVMALSSARFGLSRHSFI